MKFCSNCFETQPENSMYFSKKTKGGLTARCKGCTQDYKKEYRKKNIEELKIKRKELYANQREEAKEASRIYRINNPEKCAAWKRKHYDKNTEKIKMRSALFYKENKEYVNARNKEYGIKNADKLRAKKREYYKRNKEEIIRKTTEWSRENSDISRAIKVRYNQRKRSLIHDYEESDWDYALEYFNHSCAYCESAGRLEQEHVIPVSKGGYYTPCNIIPACRSCNASKGNKNMKNWYFESEFYNPDRLNRIFDYLEGVRRIARAEELFKSNQIH